jgi:dephospho-CoA kinase
VIRIALAGGLGSGKSTVGKALAGRGAVVIDADQVARDVVAPGSLGERAVLDRFGPGVERPDGHLDRAALAGIVFANATERLALEAITHPLIREEIDRRLANLDAGQADRAATPSGAPGVVVIEVPLLDRRRQGEYGFDVVVVVDAPEDVAVQRSVRRGMSEPDARARMAAQPTAAERLALADRVLANDGDLQQLERAVDDLWAWLVAQSSSTDANATPPDARRRSRPPKASRAQQNEPGRRLD